jgi:TPR repeat protein
MTIFLNHKVIYLDCWNYEPDDRPTINQVVAKLNAIISADIQLLQLIKSNIKVPENIISYLLHEKMSQTIQNFSKMNIKEIGPSISSNLIISNFSIVINALTLLLESIETERRRHVIINYLNDYNITSQEIYNWLLNNQDNSNSIFLLGVFNHFGIATNVNKHKALELYKNAANSGNVSGIISLGYCYDKGVGTSFDKQKAYELYKEAADLGNSRGIYSLGYCYEFGIGTNIDKQQAFELYQEAATLGNILGICNLGYCYGEGIGVSIDKQKAFELFQEAANLGDHIAQYNLALMYEHGEGVIKNVDQAIYWYKKSAEQGDQEAQYKLGELS